MSRMICTILTFAALTSSLFGLEDEDTQAINRLIDQLTVSWNESRGVGFGEPYTEDADFVNIFGMAFSGKEEIEERHIKILDSIMKESTLEILSNRLREASPGVVIALSYWKVTKPASSDVEEESVKAEGTRKKDDKDKGKDKDKDNDKKKDKKKENDNAASDKEKSNKPAKNKVLKGVFTHVFLKREGNWQIEASQNTVISKP